MLRSSDPAVQLPGAVELDHLAGLTHYCLRASVPTMDELDELIRELKEKLGADTTTKIITRTLRNEGASPRPGGNSALYPATFEASSAWDTNDQPGRSSGRLAARCPASSPVDWPTSIR